LTTALPHSLHHIDATVAAQPLSAATRLPRMSAACAQAHRALHGVRSAWPVTIGQQPVQLRCRSETTRHCVVLEQGAAMHRFVFGAHAGTLWLDAPAEARLLGDGSAAPARNAVAPTLRTVLVADALQPLVAQAVQRLRLPLVWEEPPPSSSSPPASALHFDAEWPDERAHGAIAFDDDAGWQTLVRVWPAVAPSVDPRADGAMDALQVPLGLSIGSTTLSLGEVHAIEPGDVVRVDRWSARGSAFVVDAALPGAPQWRLFARAEGRRLIFDRWDFDTMTDKPSTPDAAPETRPRAATDLPRPDPQRAAARTRAPGLDTMEVPLRFEVGELTLSLAQLKAMAPGQVLDLEQPLDECDVRILAHGNVLGEGRLIAVGERLGVRIVRFAAAQTP
jgi:type III secretion protein Q